MAVPNLVATAIASKIYAVEARISHVAMIYINVAVPPLVPVFHR
jgi:hypothetical protein